MNLIFLPIAILKKLFFWGLLIVVLTGCKTIVLKEDRFLHPQVSDQRFAFSVPEYQFDEHHVNRSDGTMAYGISMTRPGNQFSILFFGGNKFTLADKGEAVIRQLVHFGADVYMFDHRGYGFSTGQPTLALLLQDAVENFDHVRSMVAGKLMLHGHSLGSFEAGWVARNRSVDALVLESSVTHIDDWVDGLVPWPLKPFVRFEVSPKLRIVNNQTAVKSMSAPLLLLVGSEDKLTPKNLSQNLYESAKSSHKVLRVFDQANHRNVRTHPEFDAVYQAFISEVLDPEPRTF